MAASAAQIASAGFASIGADAVSLPRPIDAPSFNLRHLVLPLVGAGATACASDEDSMRIDLLHEQWRPRSPRTLSNSQDRRRQLSPGRGTRSRAVDQRYVHPVPGPATAGLWEARAASQGADVKYRAGPRRNSLATSRINKKQPRAVDTALLPRVKLADFDQAAAS